MIANQIKPAIALLALMLGSVVLAADKAPRVLFAESFGDKLDKEWAWVREEPKAWKLENNSLVLRTQPGYLHTHHNDNRNMLIRAVPDAGAAPIAVEVEMENDPKIQYEHAGVVWYYDDDNYVSLFKESTNGKPGMVMVLEKDAQVSGATKQCTSKKIWLRLIVSDGKATAQFRESEKEDWTTVGEKKLPRSGPARAGVTSGGAPQGADHLVTFKDFRIVQLPDGK